MVNFRILRVVLLFVILSCCCSCDYSYSLKIEGSPNLQVNVIEKPFSGSTEFNYKVHIPYSDDISQYAGERYRITVKKTTREGELILRIVEEKSSFFIFNSNGEIFRCETTDSCGVCKYDGYF